jgi:hypothetical protein
MSDVLIAWDYESNLTDENQAKSLAAQVSTNYQGVFLLKCATFEVEMEWKIKYLGRSGLADFYITHNITGNMEPDTFRKFFFRMLT